MPLFENQCSKESSCFTIDPDKQYLYALTLVKGLGYKSIRKLYKLNASPKSIWELTEDELLLILKNTPIRGIKDIVKVITTNRDYYINRASSGISFKRLVGWNL